MIDFYWKEICCLSLSLSASLAQRLMRNVDCVSRHKNARQTTKLRRKEHIVCISFEKKSQHALFPPKVIKQNHQRHKWKLKKMKWKRCKESDCTNLFMKIKANIARTELSLVLLAYCAANCFCVQTLSHARSFTTRKSDFFDEICLKKYFCFILAIVWHLKTK